MTSYEAIFRRRSIRKYKNDEISPTMLEKIERFGEDAVGIRPDIRVKWKIFRKEDHQLKGLFRVDAPYYVALYSEICEDYRKNAGCLMEQLSLYLFTKGIGSCYQGGAKLKTDIEKDLDVEVNDEDIRIDTYRSSGAGGQHINKTSSAIRITHFPTGIVVQCQNERSQHMNKDKAMQMLKAKLYLLKQQEAEAKLSGIRGEVTDIGWGNQIRSYVMQPYTMVKDHRTSEETGNVDAVLDGDIDPFINAYLKWIALSNKPAEQQ